MDLTPETTVTSLGKDDRWIGSTHGIDNGETGTLLTATVQSFKNALGILPSGIALGLITASDCYGLWEPEASDGREVLYGFLLSPEKIATPAGAPIAKVGISVLRHGSVRRRFLPVVAQRIISSETITTGQFVFRD